MGEERRRWEKKGEMKYERADLRERRREGGREKERREEEIHRE